MASLLILAGDTVTVRSMIMALLVEGIEAERVSRGDDLMQRLSSGQVLAVLCDMAAPWADLSPLLRRVRSQGGRRVRILLFGERPPVVNDVALSSLGLQEEDVFSEPVDMPSLARRIREAPVEVSAVARGGRRSPLGFPVQARFEATPLAQVLSLIARGKGTGQLEIDGATPITLSFKDGSVLAVQVPTGPYALASMLVSRGRLKEEERQALAKQGSITLEVLAARGVLSPHEIPQLAREQAELVLRETVVLEQGGYRWHEGALPKDGGFSLGVALHRQILDGFKRRAPDALPEELAAASPQLDAQQRELLQSWALLPYELRALNQLNGTRTVKSVVDGLAATSTERRLELNGVMLALNAIGLFGSPDEEEVIDWNVRKGQLEQELARMNQADPFEVLGVTPTTAVSDTRTRFFSLSKQYHPDRAFQAPPEVRTLMEDVFRKIQEAYEVASDPKRRDEYLANKDAEKGGLDVRAAIQAEIAFSQGELYLKNRNYSKAREFFQEAVKLNEHAIEYKVFLGWATYNDDPAQFAEAAKLIHDAVKANPNLDRGFYFLGCIFKARNEMNQAENAFKKAVAANPGNVEAQRELRLLDMRRDKDKPTGASVKGFLSRFRKS